LRKRFDIDWQVINKETLDTYTVTTVDRINFKLYEKYIYGIRSNPKKYNTIIIDLRWKWKGYKCKPYYDERYRRATAEEVMIDML